jgi:hypothetical protein
MVHRAARGNLKIKNKTKAIRIGEFGNLDVLELEDDYLKW